MRILGVDLGRRRTGLALSDTHEVTCSPFEVLEERNEEQLLLKIMRVAEEH
jgi:RNase H-fold protein (predicted Holliday junction resolvase)